VLAGGRSTSPWMAVGAGAKSQETCSFEARPAGEPAALYVTGCLTL
jgi:hypothetical protein